MRFGFLIMCVIFALAASWANAAPFVNLDFEQATVPPGTGQTIDALLAFPGWTARIGQAVAAGVRYDNIGLDGLTIALYDRPDSSFGFPQLQGTYDVFLRGDANTGEHASLSQFGDVPSDARSIRLLSEGYLGPPEVFVGGTRIALTRLVGQGVSGETDLYAGDISTFAGTTNLISVTNPTPSQLSGSSLLDNISFSSAAVPEPSPATVVVFISGWMALMRRPRMRFCGSGAGERAG